MIINYIKIAIRSMMRHKLYALLNIIGLTVGLTSFLLISLFIYDEVTYDHVHSNADHIYRLNAAYHLPNNGGFEQYAASGPIVGEMLVKDFPEVDEVVRIRRISDRMIEKPSSDQRFYENIFAVDSNYFKVFSAQVISGDLNGALLEPFTLVLTEKAALKLFNRTDIVGESVYLPGDSLNFKVTAVIENYPGNTHLKFDYITAFETLRQLHYNLSSWWSYSFYTYLKLDPRADVGTLSGKIKFISRQYIPDQEDGSGYKQEYALQNLKSIHLNSNLRSELESNSKEAYVYIFGTIGIFILVIACINFMNLATARSARRAKEVGVRKVSGAKRSQLVSQFLGESMIMAFMAMLLSVLFTVILLPYLNDITGKSLETSVLLKPVVWISLIIVIALAGLLAGSYPSLFLSAFNPVETLKGSFSSSVKGNLLRKTLVVFQFTISIVLISGTLIVYKHLTYLRDINLGFDKDQTLVIPTRSVNNAAIDFGVLKRELQRMPGVKGATLSYRVPGKEMGNNVVRLGWNEDARWSDMRFLTVDFDFMNVYRLEILEGRAFSEDRPSDVNEAFMLNESAVKRLGWKDPKEAIGQQLMWQNRKGFVIGVVKDFHFMASNVTIEPFIVVMNTDWSVAYLSVKLEGGSLRDGVSKVREKFASVLPGNIFEYFFLDEDFDQQYKTEDRFVKLFTIFACLAIIIACLGLYGLAAFTAEQKSREIGIRKVLGASMGGLVFLQGKQFLQLVLIAFCISIPVSYYSMQQWLTTFPIYEKINGGVYVISGAMSLIIAWVTVGYQSFIAASVNPVNSIRRE